MVNVTKANFLAQLSDFLEYLPTASYVAIDEEMSGISLPETSWSDNKMELPSERYARCLKGVPERYSVLQVGVSLFHRNPKYNNQNRCEQQEEEMNSLLGKLNNNELDDLLIDHDVMGQRRVTTMTTTTTMMTMTRRSTLPGYTIRVVHIPKSAAFKDYSSTDITSSFY